jgi:glycine dehydrogenase
MDAQTQSMLAALGYSTLDELTDAALPSSISESDLSGYQGLPTPLGPEAARQRLLQLAGKNNICRSLIGMGYSGTVTPAPIRRNVLENPAWYTAYTPYQPEISQGRLEALMNFQTMVADLTGLPIAGASLLDEATAVAEAVALARRAVKTGSQVVVDSGILPQSLAVLETRTAVVTSRPGPLDGEVQAGEERIVVSPDLIEDIAESDPFAVVVQVPGKNGLVPSPEALKVVADAAHAKGALLIAACDPLALTLLQAPATWGADVVVGSTQRFGVPMWFGGPHAGYIAVRKGLERQLPGRLVGQSVDAQGTPAFRLALQTREQHIRREKATSNICTAQVLLAVAASCYAVWHGPEGLQAIATEIHDKARALAAALAAAGYVIAAASTSPHGGNTPSGTPAEIAPAAPSTSVRGAEGEPGISERSSVPTFFDTILVRAEGRAEQLVAAARQAGFWLNPVSEHCLSISIGEDLTWDELGKLATVFGAAITDARLGDLAGHTRDLPFLTHPVFQNYHDETEFMRYLRTLQDRDYALDRGMIPLGSCTMKLNPAVAMEPISYAGFTDLHPFAPAQDSIGYQELIQDLTSWLAAVTGYDEVSVQPNGGSQGEFAGLLAIRGWHRANGDIGRDICLIPASAHGTNAASAAMAGFRVVSVATAPDGTIDQGDLAAKIEQYGSQLGAIMVTYPSTHGVFEEGITSVCEQVHAAGGQVYVDGANMNALMGLARPGKFGADVSHLNLHKTFAIPHGGGGPGVGPVAVRAHLAPFLPSTSSFGPRAAEPGICARSAGSTQVSAAPFGSPGVLPISYAYILIQGAAGLKEASQQAILRANYLAKRLSAAYPILYTGNHGLVAHECIVDLREITKVSHVTVDDVAKRLIDYGFHAPTMSFPVSGTLMVEPTESESQAELDRFADAMLAIKAEIDQVAAGRWPVEDSPLHNAPHPAQVVLAGEWSHPYSREVAAFPAGVHCGPIAGAGKDKYWPPVSRIDNAYGDRNLIVRHPE